MKLIDLIKLWNPKRGMHTAVELYSSKDEYIVNIPINCVKYLSNKILNSDIKELDISNNIFIITLFYEYEGELK